MGQVIDLDAWRPRSAVGTRADAGVTGWLAPPSLLVGAVVLPSLTLWRCYVAACAGWWLAPLGLAVGPAEARGDGPSPPRARRGSPD